MVSAYGVFAAEGRRYPPISILRIEDSEGNIIEQKRKTSRKVLDEEPIRILNSILSDNDARAPMFGHTPNLYIPEHQVAVKTGTTNSYRDAWTIGYTPNITAGVWAGNNDNTEMSHKPSVTIAGHIWKSFMTAAVEKLPKQDFTPPQPKPEEIEE